MKCSLTSAAAETNFTNPRHRPMPLPPTPLLFIRFTSVSTQVGQFSFRDCDFSVSTFVHPLGNCTQSLFIALRRFWSLCYHFLAEKSKCLKKVSCRSQISFDAIESRKFREAPFWNMLVLYGHCPNSFRPPPCVKRAKIEKKCPKPSWQALTPPDNMGKKCPKPTWQAFTNPPPLRAMPIWKKHISKSGFPYHVRFFKLCPEKWRR